MFTYNINIYEKNVVTSVKVDSVSYTLKLDESLDSGVLTIPRSTRRDKFNRFSRVEISINDGDTTTATTWLIYTTKVEIDSKGATKTYNHTLGLIEPTKWLEKFVVGTLTFTQPLTGTQKSLYDYVERVRQLVPFVSRDKVASTRLFAIDSDFATDIKEVIAPQLYLDKKNLREVLIELFSVVNAIPRLYYDNGWVLTGDYINQKEMPITVGDGDIDYVQEASGENFAQTAEIFHENTIPNDDSVLYEGSITDYITFRNNSIILGDNDLRLILNQPVSRLKNLWLYAFTTESAELDVVEISLNKYIFEKKVYDSLLFDNAEETQSKAVYWTYKSNEILGFSEKFGAIFEQIAADRIFADVYDRETGSLEPTNWKQMLFKVEYIPYFETTRSIQYRENYEPYALRPEMLDKYSGLIINQSERINDPFELTANVYGQIQRLGVDTVSISKKHYLMSQVYNMGDYTTDGYIVTKVEVIPYTTYVIARYELSKNWNRIAQFIQLDKEFRPYEVSLTKTAFTLKRSVLIPLGMVEISNEVSQYIDTSTDELSSRFMNTLKTGAFQENITVAGLKPSSLNDLIVKPIAPLAEKNVLKWKIDLLDTKLAGKYVVDLDRYIQKAVEYTENDGELNNISFNLYNGIWEKIETNIARVESEISYYAVNDQLVRLSNFLPLVYNKWEHLVAIIDEYAILNKLTFLEELVGLGEFEGLYFYDTQLSFPDPSTLTEKSLYVDNSTYTVYFNDIVENYYILFGYVILKKQQPVFETENFVVLKDAAEVLGFEMFLPITIHKDLFGNFVIGDSLLKENNLIKVKEADSPLYFYGLSYEISKAKTDKINLTNATQITTVQPYISENYISVPTTVYDIYDYYAVADENANLYLGVNQKIGQNIKEDISTIYFNFISERKEIEEVINEIIKDVYFANYGTITVDYTEIEIFNEDADFSNSLTFDVTHSILELFNYNASFSNELTFNTTYYVAEITDMNAQFSNELAMGISNYVITTGVEYDITYNLGGGTNSSSNPATFYYEDLPFALYEPTRSGYIFDGWFEDGSFTNRLYAISSPRDYTVYAKWRVAVKVWSSSNSIYWNAQAPSNRGEETNPSSFPYPSSGTLASNYDVGYALKVNNGSIPIQYAYWKVILQ